MPAFSSAYRSAAARYAALARKALEIRAITKRDHEPYAGDAATERGLIEERGRRLAAVRVAVSVEMAAELAGGSEAVRLEGALTRALSGLGVTATSGRACGRELALVVRAQPACGRGSFGHSCALGLSADLRPCGSGSPWAVGDLADPGFRGASPRAETDAREAMWAAVSEDALAARLGAALGSALPLD